MLLLGDRTALKLVVFVGPNSIFIAGFIVVSGSILPPPSILPLILPNYYDDLLACQRYYNQVAVSARFPAFAATQYYEVPVYFQSMRSAPAMSVASWGFLNNATLAFIGSTNVTPVLATDANQMSST